MARIIVITSGKGGVGKTTTTSNIGMALARLGKKILLLDADVGLRNLDLLLGYENRIIYTGTDVLNGACKLEQAIIKDKREPTLHFFPLCSNQTKNILTKESMQEIVDMLKNKYDFILIDSPAGIDDGFQTAIEPVDEAILVVTPEITSIRDADKVVGILTARKLKEINLIVNRVNPKMIKSETMMSIDDVQGILGIPLIGVVPDSERVIIASNRGEPLVLDENGSLPKMAFEDVAHRLLGEEIDFFDLEGVKNPVKRLFTKIRRSKLIKSMSKIDETNIKLKKKEGQSTKEEK